MHPAHIVAQGYRYPSPTALATLTEAVETLPRSAVRRAMDDFITEIGPLRLGEWEELHTRTLDLSPAFIPYVGHVTWGENYRRGEFMADLKADMERHGVDLAGELPDHIEPVLRYVADVAEPLSDLLEVLTAAVADMRSTLAAADKGNPYRHLLAATLAVVEDLKPIAIGVRR